MEETYTRQKDIHTKAILTRRDILMEGHTHDTEGHTQGTHKWKDIHMTRRRHTRRRHTRRRHAHGGDIQLEDGGDTIRNGPRTGADIHMVGTYKQSGYTHGGDVYTHRRTYT